MAKPDKPKRTPETTNAGWYPSKEDPSWEWYWNGEEWTETRERNPAPKARPSEGPAPVVVGFTRGIKFGLAVILLGVLWTGAEAHDNNCYTKATARAAAATLNGQEPSTTNCLILPWNSP